MVNTRQGGDSTYWISLIRALSQEADLFVFGAFVSGEAPGWLHALPNVEVIPVLSRNPRWWSYVAFPRAARRWGADLVHTQYSLSPLVGRRGMTTVHDVSFFVGPEWFPARHRLILQRTVPAAVRRAARVITVSETSRREIEHYIPQAKGKVSVTPLSAPEWLRQIPTDQAREALAGLDIPERFALSVSTVWPRKNMALAIDAVNQMVNPIPLLLSGRTAWGSLPASPHARALGYVEDAALAALYSLATVYLCPSHHEGFGLPVLEAFTAGCPVICSSGGALPEVAGRAACVMPNQNPVDWAQKLDELVASPRLHEQMRQNGLVRAQEFSWQRTAQGTLEAYRAALS